MALNNSCFCIGPQNGNPYCPCIMQVKNRWDSYSFDNYLTYQKTGNNMSKLDQIKQEIKNLQDQLELKQVELKHEEEKEVIREERNEAFKSAVLGRLRAGGIDELAAMELLEAVGIEATEEIEQAALQAKPVQATA